MPAAESLVLILMVLGRERAAAAVALASIVVFSLALVRLAVRDGVRVACGCFGRASIDVRLALARNVALAATAVAAWSLAARDPSFTLPDAGDTLPALLVGGRLGRGGDHRLADHGVAGKGPGVKWSRFLRAAAPLVVALATIALLAAVAGAHHTDRLDPNDTIGKLDVREVRLAHTPGPPRWTVETFAEWGTREIWDRGYIVIMLDTADGAGPEHYLLVRSSGRQLVGSLWRVRSGGSDVLGSLEVDRFSRRSATVKVALSRLDFRWEAVLLSVVGRDALLRRHVPPNLPRSHPQQGALVQWRPGMSPTPSPSPSPSPASPSPYARLPSP